MNSNVKLLESPWKSDFISLLRGAKNEIHLASPFIKKDVASLIVEHSRPRVNITFLNSFKLANYHMGASDIEALRILNDRNVNMRSHHLLHAKVFIFDNMKAVVTSANLTTGGLMNNFECGVLVNDKKFTSRLIKAYNSLFFDEDRTWPITDELLGRATKILESIPKEKKRQLFPPLEEEIGLRRVAEEQDIYRGGIKSIEKNLSGWEKDVFDVLNEIEKEIFRLRDVYQFEDRLSSLHPDNRHVKAKIRQQLQLLRDLGLIEFLERGVYRKLWK